MQHFFADRSWVQGDKIRLEGSDVNHMKNVLRMKESGDEVQCHSPFELGAKNIDWLHEMYEAVWHQLRETNNVESQIEEP